MPRRNAHVLCCLLLLVHFREASALPKTEPHRLRTAVELTPPVTNTETADPRRSLEPPRLVIPLNASGSRYVRFVSWIQVWARALELNPGSLVSGRSADWNADIALRRARLKMVAKPLSRLLAVFQIGVNNQSMVSQNPKAPFVHDAYLMVRLWRDLLHIGAGLHYWNGLSRLSSVSTATLLSLDTPIINWPNLGRTDQAGRQLGVFAKGQIDRLGYRVSLNRPFVPGEVTLVADGPADYWSSANSLSTAGYFDWSFFAQEGNRSDVHRGTYLGTKRVLNVGAGFYWHPDAMAQLDAENAVSQHDALHLALDLFADLPMSADSALTAYLVYYYFDMGPQFVRNVGPINVASGGDSFNGPGNAAPIIGTGHHLYGQLGVLLPVSIGSLRIQPYATLQLSVLDALDGVSAIPEIGINWLSYGHHLKLTTHFRNHPVFRSKSGEKPRQAGRRSSFVLQLQAYF